MNFNYEEQKNKIVEFFRKYWIPIVGAIIVIALIVSVINIYREQVLNIDDDSKYIEQDVIYIPTNSIDTLNPITTITEDSYYINKLIYDSLFVFNDDLSLERSLVQNYSIDTEKACIDIRLKSGVKFHNGETLTASDVKFTIDAIKYYGESSLYYSKASKIKSVKVENNLDIKIYFKNKEDCALDSLTFPIVSSTQYDSVSAFLKAEDFIPVGTGQYMVSSYDEYQELNIEPNKSYFGTKASKNVVVQIVPDKNNLANLIENGMITCYVDKGSQRKTTVTDNDFTMYDFISNEVEFLYFNTSSKLLENKNVRKAIAYAIDSEEILDKGYLNDGVLTDTIYYPNFLGVKDELTSYNYDLDKTTLLLNKEGYVDEDKNGKLEDDKGKEITITILVNSDNANRITTAKLISTNLIDAGFNVIINSVPWEEYQSLIKKGSYDILVTGYVIEESYDLRMFFDGSTLWKYKNKDILTKVEKLEGLYDNEDYVKFYEEIKSDLIEEVVYYPLCYKKMGVIGTKTLEVDSLPMFNNIYRNISTWEWSIIQSEE